MIFALDTTVIVAGLVDAHPHHSPAEPWLKSKPKRTRVVAAHALAETWSTLTTLPFAPRLTGEQANQLVQRVALNVRIVSQTKAVYVEAIRRCVARGLRSGAVHDAMHLIVAENARADVLLTFNIKDFERLALPGGPVIRAPE